MKLLDIFDSVKSHVSIGVIIIGWIIVFGVTASGIIFLRLSGFSVPGDDTWIFVNALYNTVEGNGLMTWLPHQYPATENITFDNIYGSNQSQLGAHAQPFLFVLIPIYAVLPSAFTLIILQAVALGAAAWPLYKLAQELVNQRSAYILSICYLLYPTIVINTRFFHPISFLPLFVFTMLYSYHQEKTLFFTISFILALSLKETTPILLAPLGFWLLYELYYEEIFQYSHLKLVFSISLIITSITWFVIAFSVFMPFFSEGPTHGLGRYEYLGSSISEIIITLVTEPIVIFTKIASVEIIVYFVSMLIPLGFIPLRSPKTIIIGSGIFMMNSLSTFDLQHTFHFQHQIPLVVPLMFSLIIVLHKSSNNRRSLYEHILSRTVPLSLTLYILWLVLAFYIV